MLPATGYAVPVHSPSMPAPPCLGSFLEPLVHRGQDNGEERWNKKRERTNIDEMPPRFSVSKPLRLCKGLCNPLRKEKKNLFQIVPPPLDTCSQGESRKSMSR